MAWSSTAITWDLQVMLMWVVLPPVFILCMLLTLVVLVLFAKPEKQKAAAGAALPKHAAIEIRH